MKVRYKNNNSLEVMNDLLVLKDEKEKFNNSLELEKVFLVTRIKYKINFCP